MAAYELIEDRNAVHADAGGLDDRGELLERRRGDRNAEAGRAAGDRRRARRQTLNGKPVGEGKAEDPYATLAWLANLLAERAAILTPAWW